MVQFSRRVFSRGLICAPLASRLRAVRAGATAPDPGRDSEHPYLPNATFGYSAMASNINADSLLTEPLNMFFAVYGFGTEDEAREAFPDVISYLEGRRDAFAAEIANDAGVDYQHRHISVGKLGDERSAYYADPSDGANALLVIVRVGPNILNLLALALSGSTDTYVASYLEEFLADATEDPMSLVPDTSDLPIGWELDEPSWGGDIFHIITTPGIGATPAT